MNYKKITETYFWCRHYLLIKQDFLYSTPNLDFLVPYLYHIQMFVLTKAYIEVNLKYTIFSEHCAILRFYVISYTIKCHH